MCVKQNLTQTDGDSGDNDDSERDLSIAALNSLSRHRILRSSSGWDRPYLGDPAGLFRGQK